ncbi:MAG: type II secretion system protein GspM [Limnohabitans sp.]
MNGAALQNALRQAWQARSLRERRGLMLAATVIGLALLWQLALAPALQTWREAPLRQSRLDQQRQQLLLLEQQARAMQGMPKVSREEALRWLQGPGLQALGTGATVRVQGEQVLVELQSTSPGQLSRFLQQAREQARALPLQAQLQQAPPAPANPASAAPTPGPLAWRGTLTLSLP